MRKLLCCIMALVMCLTFPVAALAAEEESSGVSTNSDVELLKQQLAEVNAYLENHTEPVEIKEQTISHSIPLSDGSVADYTLEIVPAEVPQSRVTVFDAIVGVWLFKSHIDLPLHGKITITTTVNITSVPDGPGGWPKFTAYGGKVEAIPIQFTTIDGSSASTGIESAFYVTSGYVGFNCAGVTVNVYFKQTIAQVDNRENYNKIQCGVSYTI